MKVFITAGHDTSNKTGTGASYTITEDITTQSGIKLCAGDVLNEAKLAIIFRDRLVSYLTKVKPTIQLFTDANETKLQQVINWLILSKSNEDLSIEIHFNASVNHQAEGSEVFVRDSYAYKAITLGRKITQALSTIGFKNRGIKHMEESQHSKLPILSKPKGLNLLLEVCFLDNPKDQQNYFENELTIVELVGGEIEKLLK